MIASDGALAEPEFDLRGAGVETRCPDCGNEMVRDPDSLALAEAPCGAMLECGRCGSITSWRFTLDPFLLLKVPNGWGGSIECE